MLEGVAPGNRFVSSTLFLYCRAWIWSIILMQEFGTTTKGSMKVSSTERKLIELYRKADASTKKKAMELLQKSATIDELSDGIGTLLGSAIEYFTK